MSLELVLVKVEVEDKQWECSIKLEPDLAPELLQAPDDTCPQGTSAATYLVKLEPSDECSGIETVVSTQATSHQDVVTQRLETDTTHIKEECGHNEAEECSSVSEEAARAELYAGHVVKRELVLGPELLQPPDAFIALTEMKGEPNVTEQPGGISGECPGERPHCSDREIKEKIRKRKREYQRAWRQRKKYLQKKVSKEEKEEKNRKRHRENQRAYYQRKKSLEENDKNVEELFQKKLDDLQMKRKKLDSKEGQENDDQKKKEDERKQKPKNKEYFKQYQNKKRTLNLLSQKKLDDFQMKRKKLDSDEDQKHVVQCKASQNLENLPLEQNQLTQLLRICEERHECITPKVILHRNTDIPGDGNCLFHSLIRVMRLQISTCDLKRQLRDSPYLNSCHNPQEAYNILSSDNECGNLDCLYLFAKIYNQNICVHDHYYNVIFIKNYTSFRHFKANDTHNWIHLDLRELHFTPYITDDEKRKEDERKQKQKNKEYSKRYRDKKKTSTLLSQKKLDDLQMKRKKLDSNEDQENDDEKEKDERNQKQKNKEYCKRYRDKKKTSKLLSQKKSDDLQMKRKKLDSNEDQENDDEKEKEDERNQKQKNKENCKRYRDKQRTLKLLSQKKLDDLQMKRKKLDSNEDQENDEKEKEDERNQKQKNREYSKRYRDKKRMSKLLSQIPHDGTSDESSGFETVVSTQATSNQDAVAQRLETETMWIKEEFGHNEGEEECCSVSEKAAVKRELLQPPDAFVALKKMKVEPNVTEQPEGISGECPGERPHCSDRTADNHTLADQPDERMDLRDLPSKIYIISIGQDAAESTPVTPSDKPQTIAVSKSKAERQREYRQRKAASRTHDQAIAERKSDAERQRNRRLRKAVNSALVCGSLESTTASCPAAGSNEVQTGTRPQLTHQKRQTEPAQITLQPGTSDEIEQHTQFNWNTKWATSILRFKSTFLDNDFGYACSVCDRLWFKNDLKPITAAQLEVISEWFMKENRRLCREEYEMVCNTCRRTLNNKSMPPLAKVNGFSYPDRPPGLPPLDPISERLISPRLPFMQVRRLRNDISYGIIGQVINLPVDVQEMVKCLPRQLDEDDVINVNIERNLAHKSVYISGYISKSTISEWLTVLQKSSLYRLYNIKVDLSRIDPIVPFLNDIQDDPSNHIENISAENTPESEILASRQHTMIWNEEDCLNIATGHQEIPLNVIYDRHAEELSFPSVYLGEPRQFNKGVAVTPYMTATSEIRRRDRRGATPQKILYVAMKILRLRMANGIHSSFRVSQTENVTRRMLEDTEFLKEYVTQNLAFMKTVPNSIQYWASRKRDLFAMIRQLGKPTFFLTISANEIHWMKLLTILLKLSKKYPGKTAKDLNISERCTLVSDDPVTCCVYFYRLVGSLMKILKSKQCHNPFGKYFVKDYFLRIEFQHLGSPHAHILLWLNDDPRETVSEDMPRTIDLVEKLSSVARDDVPNNSVYANQIHKHTFTCTKQGETSCRFGIPYWPMPTTRVLLPIPQSDGRLQTLQQKAKELHTSLEERRYACMDEFLNANGLTYDSYLDIVRSTLRRPTLVFRRNFDELMTNTFNPYLAGELNSNIDIKFILDEYSFAEYVVEYINKLAREMGDLRRELITMMQEHPDWDYTGQLKALSAKLLNAVEMSAQEAAWYLLRQPMSETSRQVVYIPTVWPTERQRYRKRRQQMDREGLDGDSTDIWTKNIIQRYEERPASLEQVYLAEFASWYANANDFVDEEDDVHVDDDDDSGAVPEARTSRASKDYRRRPVERVIRYRRYDINETVNYKREMVLLYVQFRNEMSEIVDQNKFLQLFDDNKDTIMERRSLFETNLNIENVTKELEAKMQNDDKSNLQEQESRAAFGQRLLGKDGAEKVDDVKKVVTRQGSSVVKKRRKVLTKALRSCKNHKPRKTGDHS